MNWAITMVLMRKLWTSWDTVEDGWGAGKQAVGKAGDLGFEPRSNLRIPGGNRNIKTAAGSAAGSALPENELSSLIEAWPKMTPAQRESVLAMTNVVGASRSFNSAPRGDKLKSRRP